MAKKLWTLGGKVLLGANGKPLVCDVCPCPGGSSSSGSTPPYWTCMGDGAKGSIVVDFGDGGWVNNGCDRCTEISGQYVLEPCGDGSECSWGYMDCQYSHNSNYLIIKVSHPVFTLDVSIRNFVNDCPGLVTPPMDGVVPPPNNCNLPGSLMPESNASYILDTPVSNYDSEYPTITLSKNTEWHWDGGFLSPCTGSLPENIYITPL